MTTPVVEKNQHYQVEITDMTTSGEGVGKVETFTLFIPDVVPGDVIEAKVLKVKKNFGYAKCVKIVTPSPDRTTPLCEVATTCGGCQLQHISYPAQLAWKTKKVAENLKRIGGLTDIEVLPTLGMSDPTYYRNKAQYPLRKTDETIQIGFFARRSHRIVASSHCVIQDARNEKIMEVVRDFLETYAISIYDETTHAGLVRHLVTKTAYFSREIMVCLVINGKTLPHAEILVKNLKQALPEVVSIFLSHHQQPDNVVLGKEMTLLDGKPFIVDQIGDLKFQIAPLSFFQVNPLQTKVLYDKVLEFANLNADEIVWDAYCGIGSISLFLAQHAKHVYGVEIVPEAIENAKANAKLNGLINTTFYTGKAEEVIPQLYQTQGIKADTIVVDPPRKGCDINLLETILKMSPAKVVYVSCDPATLARDLAYLTQNGYEVKKVQPVDMFPMTHHVETVCLMSRKDK
jgi:23S rRNA (uracil1939-C5)-methyltransferase